MIELTILAKLEAARHWNLGGVGVHFAADLDLLRALARAARNQPPAFAAKPQKAESN